MQEKSNNETQQTQTKTTPITLPPKTIRKKGGLYKSLQSQASRTPSISRDRIGQDTKQSWNDRWEPEIK